MPKQKPTSPVKASTQAFIEIEDIRDDIVLMKDLSAAVVIEVGAVNFWLLSSEEQMSMVYAYSNLLNSLSFPVQVLIMSKRIDVSSYFDYITRKINEQPDMVMKKTLESYREFIKTVVKSNTVLERRFFFVVPFSTLEMGIKATAAAKTLNKEHVLTRAKTSLYPKRDNLVRLISKAGLKPEPLQKQQLVELFYNLYNPSATGRQLAPLESYTEAVMTAN